MIERLLPDRTRALPPLAALRAVEQRYTNARKPLLMARAGESIARLARALWPHAGSAVMWAGAGNNGGDGLIAATHLQAAGWSVQVLACGGSRLTEWESSLPPDARWALAHLRRCGLTPQHWTAGAAVPSGDAQVDALLGIGLRDAPRADIAAAIEAMNAQRAPVLAVDAPSGLDAMRGTAAGAVVRADATLTLLAPKPGLFTGDAAAHCGELWLDDLGTAPDLAALPVGTEPPLLLGADLVRPLLPDLAAAAHKGRRGDVLVIGGADGMVGAALLAGRSAQALGAGRVYVGLLCASPPALDTSHPALMLRPAAELLARAEAAADARTVAVFGPGAGDGDFAAQALRRLLAAPVPLLLDADGLNLLARELRDGWTPPARPAPLLLTPHPLEAARLLGTSAQQVQADRLTAARELAARLSAWVVLKGRGTVIANPSQSLWINPTGNGLLATAGSGDVLSGAAGALLAASGNVLSVLAAVWLHGAAADAALAEDGPAGFSAEALPAAMAAAWSDLLR